MSERKWGAVLRTCNISTSKIDGRIRDGLINVINAIRVQKKVIVFCSEV